MKKTITLLLALITLFSTIAFAEVDFDPSQYTDEELNEILHLICLTLPVTGDNVLYDQDGLYIEFRGVEDNHNLNLLIRNETGYSLTFRLEPQFYANRAAVGTANNTISDVPDNTITLTAKGNKFVVYLSEAKDYGFKTIETLAFSIKVYADDYDDFYKKINFELNLNSAISLK